MGQLFSHPTDMCAARSGEIMKTDSRYGLYLHNAVRQVSSYELTCIMYYSIYVSY